VVDYRPDESFRTSGEVLRHFSRPQSLEVGSINNAEAGSGNGRQREGAGSRRCEQLEHAIRAACDVANDTELIVCGSQAILGEYPDAPPGLRASIEVDVQPVNRPEAVDAIDGALGELSAFHSAFGFYVHGVSVEAATLRQGWENRTIPVSDDIGTRGNTGCCLEPPSGGGFKAANGVGQSNRRRSRRGIAPGHSRAKPGGRRHLLLASQAVPPLAHSA